MGKKNDPSISLKQNGPGSKLDQLLSQDQINSIIQFIQDNWAESTMWPEYIKAIWHVLPSRKIDSAEEHRQLDWLLLPGLCCQAAGGDPDDTIEIAGAWLLFYTAAHIFDSIEDQDQLDNNLAQWGPGVNINIATGLLLSASSMLNSLSQREHTRETAHELGQEFFGSILTMASGQHSDLVSGRLELKQWNEIAEAKSGSFFSLACRSGARLGTSDPQKIKEYSDYGFQLGIMLQILDDMEDLKSAYDPENPILVDGIDCSLAVAYALEVLPDGEGRQLLNWIKSGSQESSDVDNVTTILNECGATLYLRAELDRHRNLGLTSLENAESDSPAAAQLAEFLNDMRVD
jgi:geranylgeranyl pyrophosphate synthase